MFRSCLRRCLRNCLPALALVSLLAASPHAAVAQTVSRASAKASSVGSSSLVVNLNSASATDLEALPGIGAKTAARIIEYRQKNGPFKKVEDILESSRSCPYLLSISRVSAHQSVARNR